MSKVIEIVVIGPTGSGKSHVLETIAIALHEAYGMHTQIASRELSQERALGGSSTKPSADTIFSLKERQPSTESITSTLTPDVDTSAIEGKLASFQSFKLDPLESAISSTVSLLNDHAVFLAESSLNDVQRAGMRFLGEKLNSHLNHLLSAQLKRVTADETI